MTRAACALASLAAVWIAGCGVDPPACSSHSVLAVTPQSAIADHASMAPGNQVQFVGVSRAVASAPNCAVPPFAVVERAAWQNPDPEDIQISSSNDATNGLAVCKGRTSAPVTLTGTFSASLDALSNGGTLASVTLQCN